MYAIILACTVGIAVCSPIQIDVRDRSVVTLPCYSGDCNVEWYSRTVVQSNLRETIYNVFGVKNESGIFGQYRVNINNGWRNLTISDISIINAGTYECQYANNGSAIDTYAVNITSIIDASTKKRLVSAYEGSTIVLTCRVILPTVSWMYVTNTSTQIHQIYNNASNWRIISHVACHSIVGRCRSILIPTVRLNDTGYYFCFEENLKHGRRIAIRQHVFDVRVVPTLSALDSTTEFSRTKSYTVTTDLVIDNNDTTTIPTIESTYSYDYPVDTVTLLSIVVGILGIVVIVLGINIMYRIIIKVSYIQLSYT